MHLGLGHNVANEADKLPTVDHDNCRGRNVGNGESAMQLQVRAIINFQVVECENWSRTIENMEPTMEQANGFVMNGTNKADSWAF